MFAPSRIISSLLLALVTTLTASAQTSVDKNGSRLSGINNFGRVTDKYFRGGEVTEEGIQNLYNMGVRTIVNLQDEPEAYEEATARKLGMEYYSFPLSNHAAPGPGVMDRVLELIQSSKAPIYVHCSGGKHRSGTACALYRMRVDKWSAKEAWEEEEAYGFGPPEEHPELFQYVYGQTEVAKRLGNSDEVESTKIKLPKTVAAREAASIILSGALSTSTTYVTPAEIIRLSKEAGATGDLLRLVLEYDADRAKTLWKALFTTGTEYRFDALTAAPVGTKKKGEDSIASHAPLDLAAKRVSFESVLASVAKASKAKVLEIELKRIKGRDAYYEVQLGGGATLYVDSASGNHILRF